MSSFKNILKLIIAVLSILVLTVGSASAVAPATRMITAGTGSGTAGQPAEVLIPVTIDYPDAVGVGGIAFTIVYDPAALTFLGLVQATPGQTIVDPETYAAANPVTTGYPYYNPYKKEAPYADRTYTLAAVSNLFYQYNDVKDGSNNPLGQVLVAGASAEPLTGTTLFKARFLIKSAAVGGLTYPIRLFRSIIKNTAAGYSAAGEFLPVLVGTGNKTGGVYTTLTFPVIPANLVPGGITVNATAYGIGGAVTYAAPSNANAAGCIVTLTKETAGGYVFNSQTLVGTNGLYSFSGKYPGNYKITVQSLDPNYDNYESTVIQLTNASITNANAVLPAKPQPVRVSGTVTGIFPSGLLVKVVDPGENVMGTYGVAGDGTWSSSLLPYLQSGTYGWYLVYGSLTSAKGATTFSTSALGSISGSISGIPGSAAVTASSAIGKFQKTVQVSGNGAYPTITNLVPANDYIVSVVATGLPVTYYDGKTNVSQATKVNVTAGNNTGSIGFTFVQPEGHITGWIKDSGAGAVGSGPGVVGITVYGFEVSTFALVQTTTVTGGVYDLGVKPGTYEVFVIKPNGHIFYFYNVNGTPTQRESGTIPRTVAGASDTVANTNIDIAECDKTLTGKVTYRSATGDPVANVQISAFTATNRALGLTGEDGSYIVGGLCDGSAYTVEMKPLTGNYPVQSAPVTIVGANTTKNFIIDKFAVLSGTVKSDDPSPIDVNGAMIFLKDKVTGTLVGGRVYFSANGAYSIRDVESGSYSLEVTHPDYRSFTVDFLIGSEDMTQNVVLGKGAYFKGTITDITNPLDEKNLPGATVTVTRAEMTPVYAVTNSEGFYSVYGLNEVPHMVMAQKPGYERQAQPGQSPTTSGKTVNFALAPPTATYTVSGTVTTSAPGPVIAPVNGASVSVSSQSKNFYAGATTAGDGTYSIPGLVNATDYRIVVIPPGNLPTQIATFAVSDANVTQSFEIALGKSIGGTVAGPVPGSQVYVFLNKGTVYVGFVETTTGSFTFKGLTDGADYEVLAVASGYVSQSLTSIVAGNTGVSITLVAP